MSLSFLSFLYVFSLTTRKQTRNTKWGAAGSESLPSLATSKTEVGRIGEAVTGDPMTAEGNQVISARTHSSRTRYPLPFLVSASSSASIPMDEFHALGSTGGTTPLLPETAASLIRLSPASAQHMAEQLVTLSQTFSRPIASTSRVTVWKHRNSRQQSMNFTITESFFINQVVTGMVC